MRTHLSRWFAALTASLCVLGLAACEGNVSEVAQDIELEVDWLEFGALAAGESATLTAKVHNAGDRELYFDPAVELVDERGDGAFTLDAAFASIPPREYVELSVTYTATSSAYSYGYVSLQSDDPDEPSVFIVVTGSCPPRVARATVAPSVIDFGWVTPGETGEQVVELHNTGELPVTIADVAVGGSSERFRVDSWPVEPVQPGETALITVHFDSDAGDQALGSLTLELADVESPAYAVSLSANTPGGPGNAPPHIELLSPAAPEVVYEHMDWEVEAEVTDLQPSQNGLYCTLGSSLMGGVEDDITDPETNLLTMVVDVYNEDISDFQLIDYPGVQTMELCCYDVFALASCVTFVVSVEEPLALDDGDGDGYGLSAGDCDDTDASVYPGALEEIDGVDDDCDGDVDDETTAFDDDGDGFSEDDGDCDDGDASIHPDADESGDFIDENCDGTIDEGTVTYDDDGDGFAETVGDCDDANPDVYQGAPEWCDTVDNDCDGSADEDCIDTTCPLHIIGLAADATRVQPGTEVQLTLTVVSCPDAALEYDWGAAEGTYDDDDGAMDATVTWTAPDTPGEVSLSCEVTDPDSGDSAWAFLAMEVTNSDPTAATNSGGTCQLAGAGRGPSPASSIAVLALAVGVVARRRR